MPCGIPAAVEHSRLFYCAPRIHNPKRGKYFAAAAMNVGSDWFATLNPNGAGEKHRVTKQKFTRILQLPCAPAYYITSTDSHAVGLRTVGHAAIGLTYRGTRAKLLEL